MLWKEKESFEIISWRALTLLSMKVKWDGDKEELCDQGGECGGWAKAEGGSGRGIFPSLFLSQCLVSLVPVLPLEWLDSLFIRKRSPAIFSSKPTQNLHVALKILPQIKGTFTLTEFIIFPPFLPPSHIFLPTLLHSKSAKTLLSDTHLLWIRDVTRGIWSPLTFLCPDSDFSIVKNTNNIRRQRCSKTHLCHMWSSYTHAVDVRLKCATVVVVVPLNRHSYICFSSPAVRLPRPCANISSLYFFPSGLACCLMAVVDLHFCSAQS